MQLVRARFPRQPRSPFLGALLFTALAVAACSEEAALPVADIQGGETASVGDVVRLDGSASTNPGGGTLAYVWRFIDLPEDSAAAFNDATVVRPSFVVDRPGAYEVGLVVSNGSLLSAEASFTVTVSECGTHRPEVVAISADPDQPRVGSTIRLDAQVADEDNAEGCGLDQVLAYHWSLVDLPTNSRATLNDASLPSPWLVADVSGTYTVEVVVTDSEGIASAPESFSVTVSVCGEAVPAIASTTATPAAPAVGQTTVLSASVEDADNAPGCDAGQTLEYDWSLVSAPPFSQTALQRSDLAEAWIVPDVAGEYVVALAVTDSTGRSSGPADLTLEVGEANLVLAVTATPNEGQVPLTVAFTCAPSDLTPRDSAIEYAWTFGNGAVSSEQNPSFTYTEPGLFTATCGARDVDGDLVSAGVDITALADTAPRVTVSADRRAGVEPLTVAFASLVEGGDGPLTYLWSFGDGKTSADANPTNEFAGAAVPAGGAVFPVVLTVADADGDTGSALIEIAVASDDLPAVVAAATPARGISPLEVQLEAFAGGGNGALRYDWDFGDGDSSQAASPRHTYTTGTGETFDATVVVTDEDGDDAVFTVPIVVEQDLQPSLPVLTATPDTGRTPLLIQFGCSASGGNAPLTHAWSFGDGNVSNLQNPSHVYADAPRTFTARCTVTDANGDTSTQTIAVDTEVNRVPSVSLSADRVSGVEPLTVALTASASGGDGALTYSWDLGGGTGSAPTPTQSVLSRTYTAGTYQINVMVEDEDGDTAQARITVTVEPDRPIAEVFASAIPSAGIEPLEVQLFAQVASGTPPFSFAWDFDDGTTSAVQNPIHTFPFRAAPYDVELTVTDVAGNVLSDVATVTVAQDDLPEVTLAAPVLDRTRAPVTASLSCDFTSANGPTRVQWVFGDGQTALVNNATSPQATSHTYAVPGSYAVQCIATDIDGDSDTDSAVVPVATNSVPQVTLAAAPTSGPAPLTVAFTASSSGGDGTPSFAWDFGGPGTSPSAPADSASESFAYTIPGTYIARVTVTDADLEAATATVSVTVTEDAMPVVTAVASPDSGLGPLSVQFSAPVVGGDAPLGFQWHFGNGLETPSCAPQNAPSGATSTLQNPSFTYAPVAVDTVFTARVIVTDGDGDSDCATVPVTVRHDAQPAVTLDFDRDGDRQRAPVAGTFTCAVTSPNGPTRADILFGDGQSLAVSNVAGDVVVRHTYAAPGTYTAQCIATDADGDPGVGSTEIAVATNRVPSVAIGAAPTSGVVPLSVAFTAAASGGDGDLTYAWDLGDGTSIDDGAPTTAHTYADAGSFLVRVTVSDEDGDAASSSITIDTAADLLPVVEITAAPSAGDEPLFVQFTAALTTSGNAPHTFAWHFGDGGAAPVCAPLNSPGGTASSLQNPSMTYTRAGSYTARVVVTDANGDTSCATASVEVADDVPAVTAAAAPISGGSPLQVQLSATTEGGNPPFSYAWTFGDGTSGSGANTSHTYTWTGPANPQLFPATVRITDADGDEATHSVDISVNAPNRLPEPAIVVLPFDQPGQAPCLGPGRACDLCATETAILLDACGSTDPDGDILSYEWSIREAPPGTSPEISNRTTCAAVLDPDWDGYYVAQLRVSDGRGGVQLAERTIRINNLANVERTWDQAGDVGELADPAFTLALTNHCGAPFVNLAVEWTHQPAVPASTIVLLDDVFDPTDLTGVSTMGGTFGPDAGMGLVQACFELPPSGPGPALPAPCVAFEVTALCVEDLHCANTTTGACAADTGLCAAANCDDFIQNQGETEVDCGGACGATCDLGQACEGNDDCLSGFCSEGACAFTGNWYVDASAPGANNGFTWQSAFTSLQAALDNPLLAAGQQIWVADTAIYTPTGGESDPRDNVFAVLTPGIEIYGGFAGTENDLAEREPGRRTTLSGDLDGNDAACDQSFSAAVPGFLGGNARTVVFIFEADGVLLDGLRITGGNADGQGMRRRGGGLKILDARDVRLRDVTIECNNAFQHGGGIVVEAGSDSGGLDIRDSAIRFNRADLNGGGLYLSGIDGASIDGTIFEGNRGATFVNSLGGGLFALNIAGPLNVTDSQFIGNRSEFRGGAVTVLGSHDVTFDDVDFDLNSAFDRSGAILGQDASLWLTDVRFTGNDAGVAGGAAEFVVAQIDIHVATFAGNTANLGGALSFDGGPAIVSRASFIDNQAGNRGGAIYVAETTGATPVQVVNSLFSDNAAASGGGAIATNLGSGPGSPVDLLFSTLYGNLAPTGEAIHQVGDALQIDSSIIWACDNCIAIEDGNLALTHSLLDGDEDPLFVDPDGDPRDLRLLQDSPAIDAANPDRCAEVFEDRNGSARPAGDACDVGAFEFASCFDYGDMEPCETAGCMWDPVGSVCVFPATAAACVVVGDQSGRLTSYTANGELDWQVQPSSGFVASLVVDSQGSIYASFFNDNSLRKFDGAGSEILDGTWPIPFLGTGHVAIDDDDNVYIAQNSTSGSNVIRRITPDGDETLSVPYSNNACSFGVAGDGSAIGLGSCSSPFAIRRYDASGEEVTVGWPFTGHLEFPRGLAIGPDGALYSGGDDSRLFARNADGSQRWLVTNPLPLPNGKNPVHVFMNGNGMLFQADDFDAIARRNPLNGAVIWDFRPPPTSDNPQTITADDTGILYVGLGGTGVFWLRKVNPDGTEATDGMWPVQLTHDPRRVAACR